jgi:hypothetical protein
MILITLRQEWRDNEEYWMGEFNYDIFDILQKYLQWKENMYFKICICYNTANRVLNKSILRVRLDGTHQ